MEEFYLEKCKKQIEDKLKWGDSTTWTRSSFERLSEIVSTASNYSISSDTLKKIYGYKKPNNNHYNPQIATKNALAQFLDFKDWNDFISHCNALSEKTPLITPSLVAAPKRKTSYKKWLALPVITLILFICSFLYFNQHKAYDISLTIKRLNNSYPMGMGFYYDVSRVKSKDIVLSFGDRNTIEIEGKAHATNAYRMPYVYHPEIAVDGRVVYSVPVVIPTDGWVATTQDRIIKNINNNGKLYLSPERIKAHDIVFANDEFSVEYRNINSFEADGSNFSLSTSIKHELPTMNSASLEFEVLGDKGKLWFIIVEPGAKEWVKVVFGDMMLDGRSTDLGVFERNIFVKNDLNISVRNNIASIFFGGKKVYSLKSKEPIGKVKGFLFRFKGTGSVEYFKLYNEKEQLIYEDEFDNSYTEVTNIL